MASTGAGVLTSLKNKMQNLREELEKYKDLYDEKCLELDEERAKRADVGVVPNLAYTCRTALVASKLSNISLFSLLILSAIARILVQACSVRSIWYVCVV